MSNQWPKSLSSSWPGQIRSFRTEVRVPPCCSHSDCILYSKFKSKVFQKPQELKHQPADWSARSDSQSHTVFAHGSLFSSRVAEAERWKTDLSVLLKWLHVLRDKVIQNASSFFSGLGCFQPSSFLQLFPPPCWRPQSLFFISGCVRLVRRRLQMCSPFLS